jgi:hypothetical protein
MVPPDWHHYTQFWHVWNDQLGTGAQKILDSSRFPTLFIAAALQGLGVDLVKAQMVQFVFWFTIPGIGMYYLMAAVYHGEHQRLARLAAVLFYMFNLWLISNWLGYKEPMIAAVAVLPFIVGIWVKTFSAQSGYIRAVLLSGLVSLPASSIGNNVSEMIAAMLIVPLLFFSVLLIKSLRRRWRATRNIFFAGLGLIVLLPLLHAFWVVPEVAGIRAAQASNSFPELQRTSSQFLAGQSLYTSLTNNIRFVSDWTWYQGLVDPYRTYASNYASNILLMTLGWATFGFVIVGAILGRGRYKSYFILATVFGLIASAGLNSPFGPIYGWAVDNLPFVWIIRSPWFKFSIITVLGYSVLLGISAPSIVRFAKVILSRVGRISSQKIVNRGALICAYAVFVALGPVYAYPLTFGLSFATESERTFLNPNHLDPPSYVYEAANWLNNQDGDFRIMTIPGDSPWLNTWGYSGFGSFLQTLTTHPVVFKWFEQSVKISQGAPNLSGELVAQLDNGLLDESTEGIVNLLSRLGVRFLVHEHDVRYDFYQGTGYRTTDSPENLQELLGQVSGLTLVKTFGEWDIYEVSSPRKRFTIISDITSVVDLDAGLMTHLATSATNSETVYVDSIDLPPGARHVLSAAAGNALSSYDANVIPINFADSTNLSGTNKVPVAGPSFEYGDPNSWGDIENLVSAQEWRWFTLNNGDHYLVTNDSESPVIAELTLEAFSYARQRSLFVHLNSELLDVADVPPDIPTTISIPKTVMNPGVNIISFYTPYQSDERDDQNVSFAIRQDPELIRSVYTWKPPANVGDYELIATLRPFRETSWPSGQPTSLVINVDGLPINLKLVTNSSSVFKATVTLTPSSTITFPQMQQEEYFLQLSPVMESSNSSDNGIAIPQDESPTNYKVLVDCEAACVLLFNESFHNNWVALVDGAKLEHFQVDNYANAYVIDRPGVHLVKIHFEPQKWFEVAVMISATTAVFTILGLIILRKRTTPLSENSFKQ